MRYHAAAKMFLPDQIHPVQIQEVRTQRECSGLEAKTFLQKQAVKEMRGMLEYAMVNAIEAGLDNPRYLSDEWLDAESGLYVKLDSEETFIAGMATLCRTIGMTPEQICKELE